MSKKYAVAAVLIAVLTLVFTTSCTKTYKQVKQMQKLEEGVSNPTTKEELKDAIKKYDERAMDLVAAQSQEGIWYKILGTRYLDERMYRQAYEAFQQALIYYPDNANLYYYTGVCAGFIANSELDFEAEGGTVGRDKKMNYLKLSESAFLQALSIDPKYWNTMYALGVLYVFELNECDKAIPYLEKFLETQVKNTDGMFVLARAYYVEGEYEKAIAMYDKIVEINPNAEKTEEAKANRAKVVDAKESHN